MKKHLIVLLILTCSTLLLSCKGNMSTSDSDTTDITAENYSSPVTETTSDTYSGKEIFTDEFCNSVEKIIYLNSDNTSVEIADTETIHSFCEFLQSQNYTPYNSHSFTFGDCNIKFMTSNGVYGIDYGSYLSFMKQEYWIEDSDNFTSVLTSYKEKATECSTTDLSGKEVFPDEFCNSLEKIVYHNFDGTTIEITDSETLQEICQLLQEKTYTPYIQTEALYGWYSLGFVTQNGERSMGYTGNIINIERDFYRITNSAEFIEKLNSYKGN